MCHPRSLKSSSGDLHVLPTKVWVILVCDTFEIHVRYVRSWEKNRKLQMHPRGASSFLSAGVSFSRITRSSLSRSVPVKSGMRVRRPVGDCNLSPFGCSKLSDRTLLLGGASRDRRSASEWNVSAQILNWTRCHASSIVLVRTTKERF